MLGFEFLFLPIVGSIIGYSTNWIAIKMLFKPKKKKFFLKKIPIPFTPGILPRNKKLIAKKISHTIFNHIFNNPLFKKKMESNLLVLENLIHNKMKEIANSNKPISLYEIIPLSLKNLFLRIYQDISPKLEKKITSSMLYLLKDLFNFNQNNASSYVKIRVIYFFFNDILIKKFSQFNFQKLLSTILKKSNNSFSNFLPNSFFIDIQSLLEKNYPEYISFLKRILVSKKFNRKLEEILEKIILEYLENSLTPTQKIFSNIFNIEEDIKKKIPMFSNYFIENIFQALNEDSLKKEIINEFLYVLKNFFDKPFHSFEKKSIDTLLYYIDSFEKKMKYLLLEESKEKRHFIFSLIRYISYEILTLEKNSFPLNSIRWTFLNERVFNLFLKSDIRDLFSNFENIKMSNSITHTFLNILRNNQKKLLNVLNIEKIIEETISDFHEEDIEKIILSILENELKWINIFGALIGFIIGLIQVSLILFL